MGEGYKGCQFYINFIKNFIYQLNIDLKFLVYNKNLIGTMQQSQPLYKKIDNYIFKFNDILGQGNFSKVYRGINEKTNEAVAIKVIELNSLKSKKLQQLLFSQIDVLKKLNHPNVLKCYEVFTSNRNCYIITQVCNGGDLETKLRKYHHFTEMQAEPYIMDIFKGLRYLSQNHVIHRDLKVANVFLNNGVAKIADFGFAKFTKQNFKDINIGSPIYMSPEGFIDNIYGPKTDVWAFGVLIYELLHGKTPFSQCNNQIDLRRQIRIPISYSSLKSDLSFDTKDMIIKCLQVNEEKRITIAQLAEEPYFKKLIKMDVVTLGVRKNNLLSPQSSNQVSRAITPNTVSNGFYQNRPEPISSSLQKNRYNVKSFLGTYQNQDKEVKYRAQNLALNSPSHNSKPYITNLESKPLFPRNDYTSPFRLDIATQQNRHTSPQINPIVYSANILHGNKPRIDSTYVSAKQNVCFPGVINFKQAVNGLHYCRLIYKFLTLGQSMEQNENKLFSTLSAQMFKVLSQISSKIDRKQISYDKQNNKKQQKLREVSNQYYRKYSLEIEKPFNKDVTNEAVISQVKRKIQDYESIYLHRAGENVYINLLHFLVIILESTEILKRCLSNLRFRDWAQYTYIQDFLSWNKSSMNYQTFLSIKQRVLKT